LTHRKLVSGVASIAVLSILLVSTGPAHATEKGFYLGFGIGQSELVKRDTLEDFCDALFVVCGKDNDGTAVKGIFGYQFNNFVALEAAIFDLGSPGISTEAPIEATADANMSGISISVLPQIPILDIGALYGKLGVAGGDISVTAKAPIFDRTEKDSTTAGTLVYGAGGAINLGRNATVRVEWERYAFDETLQLVGRDLDTPEVDVFSVNILFRFPRN